MRVEGVGHLLLAGAPDIDVNFHLLFVRAGCRRFTAFLLSRVFLRFLLCLFHAAAQFREGRDLVALFLQIEVVHLLLGQVDDLAGLLVHGRLPVVFDGHRRQDAVFRGLAAEEVHHASEHAAELDARFLIRSHVGVERKCGRDEQGRASATAIRIRFM